MRKELVREVAFGKAIARITVEGSYINQVADGIEYGKEMFIQSEVAIIKDGEVIETSRWSAEIMDFKGYKNFYERNNLDKDLLLSKVGKCQAMGKEAAEEINAAIKEMREEIAIAFNEQTDAEKTAIKRAAEQNEKIEYYEGVIASAKKEGVEKLMTREELKKWIKEYNDGMNEGGDGYIPIRVSKESYEEALSILGRMEEKSNLRKAVEAILFSDISAYGLAKETGVTQAAITQYRTGKRSIDNMTLTTIEKLLAWQGIKK